MCAGHQQSSMTKEAAVDLGPYVCPALAAEQNPAAPVSEL